MGNMMNEEEAPIDRFRKILRDTFSEDILALALGWAYGTRAKDFLQVEWYVMNFGRLPLGPLSPAYPDVIVVKVEGLERFWRESQFDPRFREWWRKKITSAERDGFLSIVISKETREELIKHALWSHYFLLGLPEGISYDPEQGILKILLLRNQSIRFKLAYRRRYYAPFSRAWRWFSEAMGLPPYEE